MSEVTLTRVFRKDVETKYGIKPKLSIQTDKHGESWLSTFKVAGTENWNEGDVVNINVQEKGDFLNFVPVGVSSNASSNNSDLALRVERLEAHVFGGVTDTTPTTEEVIEAGDEEEGDGF